MNRTFFIVFLALLVSFVPDVSKSQQCKLCGYDFTNNPHFIIDVCNDDTAYIERKLTQSGECYISACTCHFKRKVKQKEEATDILSYESKNMSYITDKEVIEECNKLRKTVIEYLGKEKALKLIDNSYLCLSLVIGNNGEIETLEFWYKCPIDELFTTTDILKLTKTIIAKANFVSPNRYNLKETKLFTISIWKKHINDFFSQQTE